MMQLSWLLCDVEQSVYLDEFSIGSSDAPGSKSYWRVNKRTLRGGLQDGVDVVEVDNGAFRFTLLPTRGMSLWRGWLGNREIGWRSPVRGPVHPRHVPILAPDGYGWLEGFDELLVRCGLVSNGAPDFDETGTLRYPLHGRIGNLPAHRVEIRFDPSTQQLQIIGVVEECRFHFHRLRLTSIASTRLGESGLEIHDCVQNLSARATTMQLLYHFNIGSPLLDAGSTLTTSARTVVPKGAYGSEQIESWATSRPSAPEAEEEVYFLELQADVAGQSRVLLKNAAADFGVGMSFDLQQLPCFTLWKNPVGEADGFVTALEPGTNYPNSRTFEAQQGRALAMAPQERKDFTLRIEFHEGTQGVARAQSELVARHGCVAATLYGQPQVGWCMDT